MGVALKAGKLRKRVEIQKQVVTRTNGENVLSYVTISQRWAGFRPLSGREYIQSQQVQGEADTEITIRYFAGLTTTHRIKWGNRIFDIVNIPNTDERNVEMKLLCKESV